MIELNIGTKDFTCSQVKSVFSNQERFRVSSIDSSRLADSIEDFMKFVNFELAAEEAQRIEWNEEFAEFPEEQISKFRISSQIQGEIDITRMEFSHGVCVGNKPYTAEF
jgi:hypothetical protein